MRGYLEDLAYIHDAGFGDYARNAAPGLLSMLRKNRIASGLIVDLGCGSGIWAAELNRAGYRVLGVDQSAAIIRIARKAAPQSQFQIASLLSAKLPTCDAVTSLGECINYAFDSRNSRAAIQRLFQRIYRALRPGGVFIFDFATPARIPKTPEKKWMDGGDWAILVTIDGDTKTATLRRRIVTFRKSGRLYRRSEELHTLRLYSPVDLVADLADCGFAIEHLRSYGQFPLPPGIAGLLATKPA